MQPPANATTCSRAPARWTAEHVRAIRLGEGNVAPILRDGDVVRITDDIDLWDAWPVQREDGRPACLGEGIELWMALGAPRCSDPDARHHCARIHLFERRGSDWRHLGPAMPDGFSPGSREWSGSAVLAADDSELALYFTAAGRREERAPTFEQRLFLAEATLQRGPAGPALVDWRGPREVVRRDPVQYMASDAVDGAPGSIKAFRDPAFFRDPADGRRYLFFAASQQGSASACNGVVGWAVEQASGHWASLPPIISGDTLNNEFERPHAMFHRERYYLFWSTQRQVFDPTGPVGPTGLYGMVSARLDRGWQPLNGTGLVIANPPEAPAQAYSWLVLPDLSVTSFVDDWGPVGKGRERRFGATFAPELRLQLDGATARLAS